jgi:hypothetical protein
MTGHPDYNRPMFLQKESELIAKGYDVLNPARLEDGHDYEWYMTESYKMIDECEAVYMLIGWRGSPGATKELQYAWDHSKTIFFERERGRPDGEMGFKTYQGLDN